MREVKRMLPLLLAQSSPSILLPPPSLSTPIPPPCQLRGVPAKWVLPLERSLSNWLLPHTPPPSSFQLRGVPAKWVLPLEKSLSNCLTPRTAALEQDMLFGHYVSKHYHQGNRMEASAPT